LDHCSKKNDKLLLKHLFYIAERDTNTVELEVDLLDACIPLTHAQRTAEWFTLRQFHVSSTMAAKILTSNNNNTNAEVLQMLSDSWFSRARSTPDMVAGTKNEGAILEAFLQHENVKDLFECGLLESKEVPWLAASPDAIAILSFPEEDMEILAVVEIKTRVSHQKIAAAERVLARYNSTWIEAEIGDDVWNECIEKDHQYQLLVQMVVTNSAYCCYVVGKAGFEGSDGRIIYIVGCTAKEEVMEAFMSSLSQRCNEILSPFYTSVDVETVLSSLPEELAEETKDIIRTRWPFFHFMRTDVTTKYDPPMGFPATALFKTPFQALYNAFKGGLDNNTQQYCSIKPMMKTCFETKYVIRLLLSIVTNSWRAKQFLSHGTDEAPGMETYRKILSNHGPNLRDFTHKLALGLIESSTDPYFQNVIFSQTNNSNDTQVEVDYNIPRDPTTLKRRIESCTWPKRFKLKRFSTDPTFVELHLTSNGEFQHKCEILRSTTTRKKAHCALCLDAQT
jgi:hypothetical protein